MLISSNNNMETEYFVIKRTRCDRCIDGIYYQRQECLGGNAYRSHESKTQDPGYYERQCTRCDRGYIETRESLIDVLGRLRFAIDGVPSDKFEVMRIADE